MKSKRVLFLRIAIVVLCLVWQGVIYGFSAEDSDESGGRSQGLCYDIVHLLCGDERGEAEINALADKIEPAFRILAHMFCYSVLGGLYFLLFASFGCACIRRSLFSVGCALVYAVFDEVHQYFVPGRSMQLVDVIVDTAGAVLAVCSLSLILHLALKRRKKK